MGMQRQVVRLAPSGIVYDIPPDGLPENVFTGGSNVVFRDGLPVRVDGQLAVYGTPLWAPQYLVNLRGYNENFWVYCSAGNVAVINGLTHSDISPTPALQPTAKLGEWTGGELNGIVVLNNKYNDPMYWGANFFTDCAFLPGWPAGTKCKAMRPFKYHLFAMNITDANGIFSDMVMWSDAAEPSAVPQSWTPTPENQAGFLALSAGGGNVIDACQLRDTLFVFCEASTWAIQYVGGNAVFNSRKVLESSGMLATNCAVEIKGVLIVLTDSDVIMFDGQQAVSIIDKRNKLFLFNQLDPANFEASFVCKNWVETEVWVCFPTIGHTVPNMALVWSRDENAWGIRTINYPFAAAGLVAPTTALVTWDTETTTWAANSNIWDGSTYKTGAESLLAIEGNSLQAIDLDVTNNGVFIEAHVEKVGLSLGDPQTRKLIKRIWPRFSGVPNTVVTVRAGGHDEPNGDVVWDSPKTFTIGFQEKVDTIAQGRYMAIQITSESEQPWMLSGFDVEYSTIGGW